jgi:hypothetical protein
MADFEKIATLDVEEIISSLNDPIELLNYEMPNSEDNVILLKKLCKVLYNRIIVLEEQHNNLKEKTVKKR